jgi:predicted PurR-regulated permease PerM
VTAGPDEKSDADEPSASSGQTLARGIRDIEFSPAVRWFLIGVVLVAAAWFISRIGSIIWPFVWALLVAYLVMPIVNFVNFRLRIPRFLVILGLFLVLISAVITGSRYLVPWLHQQLVFFAQDLPKLNGSLMSRVGPNPLGIHLYKVESQLSARLTGATTNSNNATKLLRTAFSTAVRILLFLFTTFYLLLDGPRMKRNIQRVIPAEFRPEIMVLFSRINSTWMSYIRGELILFGIMTTASFIGLTILGVPGAIALAIATGLLELLPIVGPLTAGALAVSVAYLNGSNPFGWSQITYGVVVALMYLLFRETEDYVVIPRVLGRAVKLHPLVILFALTSGGVVAGLFGLLVAVPIAASLKIIGSYLYDKLVASSPEFPAVHGIGSDSAGP